MKNLVQDFQGSSKLTLTAPVGGVVSGSLYVIGDFVGIAESTVAAGSPFVLLIKQVVTFKKKTADTFAEGAKCYYDSTNVEITSTAMGNKLVGHCVVAVGAVAGNVTMLLDSLAV